MALYSILQELLKEKNLYETQAVFFKNQIESWKVNKLIYRVEEFNADIERCEKEWKQNCLKALETSIKINELRSKLFDV